MVPVEWPIADRSDDRAASSTRRADRDRLSTVRADFFLDPRARLTEQERALMTAMLADLVASVADEVRAAAQLASGAANDDGADLFERLVASGLLDIPDLIALLLCRAEQERLSAAIRQRATGARASFLHGLAASDDASVSAAAMAVILGRSRRRDRFDAPRITLDDVAAEAAVRFVNAVTAAIHAAGAPGSDRHLADAATALLARHDEGKCLEALCFALVHALEGAGRLDDDILRSALTDGELGIYAEALARRAAIDVDTAWSHLASGGHDLALLLRMAAVPRQIAAEIAAAMGTGAGMNPAELIGLFDSLSEDEVEQARGWLRLDHHYRQAITAYGAGSVDPAD